MKLNVKNFARWLTVLLMWLAVSCTAMDKQLEPLYGIVLTKGNIRIQVNSNGCTRANSFKLSLENDELSIYRIKPDTCRRGHFRVWVDFAEHYSQDRIKLINPIKFFDKSL